MNPFVLASVYGFFHAFEADHLLAVSGIVAGRKSIIPAIADGVLWGLGHSIVILLCGSIINGLSISINPVIFTGFEALVGIVLISIGTKRLILINRKKISSTESGNKLAFSTGMIHGLAGSGALILVLLPEITGNNGSVISMGLFGLGSLAGMALAACCCFIPFHRKIHQKFSKIFILLSGTTCCAYGLWIFIFNTQELIKSIL